MKKLIMITNLFPYGNDTGEMYLRNEIEILLAEFDSISIIACDAKSDDSLFTDKLEKKIDVFALQNKKSQKFGNKKYFFNMIKLIFLKKNDDIKKEFKNVKKLKNKMFLLYFLAKSNDRIKRIKKYVDIKKIKSDEIIIYSYRFFDLAYVGIELGKLLNISKIKIISRAHGYDLYEYRNNLNFLPMREYLLEKCDLIYPCSIDGEMYLKNKYPKYSTKIKVSYLGTNDYKADYLPIQNGILEIVSCSNVIPVKRVQLIANIVRKLNKKIKIHWTHIGGGSQLEKMKNDYSDLIEIGIITLIGSLPHNQVVDYYKEHHFDLFINLSLSEGIPQAIMEAISFGIPVIATNVGGNCEIVKDNISGFLVDVEINENQIIQIIEKYYKLPEDEIIKKRKNTRSFWEKTFNTKINEKYFINELRGE